MALVSRRGEHGGGGQVRRAPAGEWQSYSQVHAGGLGYYIGTYLPRDDWLIEDGWREECPEGALMFYPCLFYPSDNMWRSRRGDAPRCAHFSNVNTVNARTEAGRERH